MLFLRILLMGCLSAVQTGPIGAQALPTSEDGYEAAEPESSQRAFPYLSTRGQVQLQYDSGDRGTASGDDPAIVLNGISTSQGADRLNIRRARVVTTLHLSEAVQLVNESNYDTRTNGLAVLDLYMRAQLAEGADLRAGMFKIPFGWEGLRSSRSTNTIEMSDVTRGLSSFRDSGLAFTYQKDGWEFSQAVVQGQAGVWTDLNPDKDWVGRVSYALTPTLRLGASAHLGSYQTAVGTDPLPVRRYGLEFQFAQDAWKLEGEYLWSRGFNYFSQTDSAAQGGYLALVRQLDARNDLVLHFDRFDPDLNQVDRLAPNNRVNARHRFVLGWNYYFERQPEHRLMVNYEWAGEDEGPRPRNNGLRARYQYAW